MAYTDDMDIDPITGQPNAVVLEMLAESQASHDAGHSYPANTPTEKAHVRALIEQQTRVILAALQRDRAR